jgi:hypothetical protein
VFISPNESLHPVTKSLYLPSESKEQKYYCFKHEDRTAISFDTSHRIYVPLYLVCNWRIKF